MVIVSLHTQSVRLVWSRLPGGVSLVTRDISTWEFQTNTVRLFRLGGHSSAADKFTFMIMIIVCWHFPRLTFHFPPFDYRHGDVGWLVLVRGALLLHCRRLTTTTTWSYLINSLAQFLVRGGEKHCN